MIRKKLETSESEDPAGDSEEYEEDEDEEDEDEEDEDEEQTSEEETEEDCNAESCTSATPDSTCEDEEEEEENMEFNYASRPNRTMNGSKSRTTLNKPLGGSSTISWAGSLPKSKSWQSSVRPSQTSVYASQQPSERASQGAKQKEMRRSNASSLKNTQDDGRGTLRLSQVASLASKARSTSSSFFGRCIRFDDEEDDDDDDDDDEEEEEEEEEPKNGRQRASTPSPNKGRYSSQEPQAFKKVQIPDSTEVLKVEWTVKMPKNLYVGAGAGGSNNVGWSPELRSCLSTSSLIAGNVIGAVADGAPYGYNPSMMAGGYYQGQQQGGYGGYPGGGYGPQQSFYGVPGGGGGGGGYFTAYGPPMSPEPPPYYYHQSHSIPTTMRWTATGSCPVAQCPLCGYTYQAPR